MVGVPHELGSTRRDNVGPTTVVGDGSYDRNQTEKNRNRILYFINCRDDNFPKSIYSFELYSYKCTINLKLIISLVYTILFESLHILDLKIKFL